MKITLIIIYFLFLILSRAYIEVPIMNEDKRLFWKLYLWLLFFQTVLFLVIVYLMQYLLNCSLSEIRNVAIVFIIGILLQQTWIWRGFYMNFIFYSPQRKSRTKRRLDKKTKNI